MKKTATNTAVTWQNNVNNRLAGIRVSCIYSGLSPLSCQRRAVRTKSTTSNGYSLAISILSFLVPFVKDFLTPKFFILCIFPQTFLISAQKEFSGFPSAIPRCRSCLPRSAGYGTACSHCPRHASASRPWPRGCRLPDRT